MILQSIIFATQQTVFVSRQTSYCNTCTDEPVTQSKLPRTLTITTALLEFLRSTSAAPRIRIPIVAPAEQQDDDEVG